MMGMYEQAILLGEDILKQKQPIPIRENSSH